MRDFVVSDADVTACRADKKLRRGKKDAFPPHNFVTLLPFFYKGRMFFFCAPWRVADIFTCDGWKERETCSYFCFFRSSDVSLPSPNSPTSLFDIIKESHDNDSIRVPPNVLDGWASERALAGHATITTTAAANAANGRKRKSQCVK